MFQLDQTISFEQIVKKSRFRAIAIPVGSEDDAKKAIAQHGLADANHNCWAWRVGAAYRFSDDGEPGGTAGKPILAAINGQSIDNVLVIVSRWFGGVLLGTGGLIRAYGGTASACLRTANLIPVTVTVEGRLQIQFSDLALIKARLSSLNGVVVIDEHFTEAGAEITAHFPEADIEAISKVITDLTSGRTSIARKL